MIQKLNEQRIIQFLIVLMLALIMLNSQRYFTRFDMTSNKIYSIAKVTKNLSEELEDTLFITYYISERLRTRAAQTEQVIDLLREYAAYGKGRIQLDIIDPLDENLTVEIEQLGIVPQQIQVIEEDQQSVAVVYTGIVIRYLGRHEVIPVVFDITNIEYQLTSTIRALVRDDERVIGILTDGDERNDFNNLQDMTQTLQQNFSIRQLVMGEPIAPEIDALIVLGTANFGSEAAYYINKYIMDGGPALLTADLVPIFIDPRVGNIYTGEVESGPYFDLLSAYGVDVEPMLVLDSNSQNIPVTTRSGAFTIQTMMPYPHWITIHPDNVDSEHPITSRFTGLDLFWPSKLNVRADDIEAELRTIVKSSDNGWLMKDNFIVDPQQNLGFSQNESRGSYELVISLTGKMNSADISKPEDASDALVPASVDNARLIIVADQQFLTSMTRFTGESYNMAFIENAVEWLSNDEDLLQIRTRAARDPRLNQDAAGFAARKVATEVLNMVGIPLIVVVYGVVRMLRRKRKAQLLMNKGAKNNE